ncbi:MAG TPA: hypothetical protein VGT24_05455 [Candidatus Acidoferrales bacterium]|nr:hypothetical protein [Candidatus Acidoferrales bacterium]
MNKDLIARYDATLRHLRKRLAQYETEAAKLTGVVTESEAQRYQAALRVLLEAVIQHAREIAKLKPQLKRPN